MLADSDAPLKTDVSPRLVLPSMPREHVLQSVFCTAQGWLFLSLPVSVDDAARAQVFTGTTA